MIEGRRIETETRTSLLLAEITSAAEVTRLQAAGLLRDTALNSELVATTAVRLERERRDALSAAQATLSEMQDQAARSGNALATIAANSSSLKTRLLAEENNLETLISKVRTLENVSAIVSSIEASKGAILLQVKDLVSGEVAARASELGVRPSLSRPILTSLAFPGGNNGEPSMWRSTESRILVSASFSYPQSDGDAEFRFQLKDEAGNVSDGLILAGSPRNAYPAVSFVVPAGWSFRTTRNQAGNPSRSVSIQILLSEL